MFSEIKNLKLQKKSAWICIVNQFEFALEYFSVF